MSLPIINPSSSVPNLLSTNPRLPFSVLHTPSNSVIAIGSGMFPFRPTVISIHENWKQSNRRSNLLRLMYSIPRLPESRIGLSLSKIMQQVVIKLPS